MLNTLPALAFGLGVGYFALIFAMPQGAVEDPVGPRMFPMLIAGGIVLCGIFLWREARATGAPAETVAVDDPRIRRKQFIGMAGAALGTLLFVAALEPLGFLAASFLLLAGLLTAFHPGRHATNILVAIGLPLALYLGLKNGLGVALPVGILAPFLG